MDTFIQEVLRLLNLLDYTHSRDAGPLCPFRCLIILHVRILDFSCEALTAVPAEPVIAHYFMDEQRKLKLNEIHYFDHPNFGVILTVKPLEEPGPET